ncbi:Rid family detoxifying hydrolase [Oceanispirochaeta sp.]|jgi:2-iminobutanoate/2-iminopropanoate deaminase|uniref:Rid family detoxifying hydrolase n=1 Tax=Oceanispirochaeta sp. TaxID=2035350 RepID=UPI0026088BEA|nr:Rid family detoxifying hydrolase [Oceanispirochaeta sp.]MDA3958844.1 Rid family detoxifying hydrolase [Oceanispirochaeta sp.]
MKSIKTELAPAAVGPYSQGIDTGTMVFTSGQLPIDPVSGKMIDGPIEEQTRLSLLNVEAVLKEAGSDLNKVVKVTVFVKDMGNFSRINEVYKEFFSDHKPARSLVEAARLPLDGEIEIEAIALK